MFFTSKSDQKFYNLLTEAARNIADTADLFREAVANMNRIDEYAVQLKALEDKGDHITHQLIYLLNKMFVTPLDREDILNLAVQMDDVVDSIEACAARLSIYNLREADRFMSEFAQVLTEQAAEIAEAVDRLKNRDLQKLRENAVKINLLENQGDDLLRKSLSQLFAEEKDPIRIIKLKEIYETLEQATDRAEDVANSLESVVMKNA